MWPDASLGWSGSRILWLWQDLGSPRRRVSVCVWVGFPKWVDWGGEDSMYVSSNILWAGVLGTSVHLSCLLFSGYRCHMFCYFLFLLPIPSLLWWTMTLSWEPTASPSLFKLILSLTPRRVSPFPVGLRGTTGRRCHLGRSWPWPLTCFSRSLWCLLRLSLIHWSQSWLSLIVTSCVWDLA